MKLVIRTNDNKVLSVVPSVTIAPVTGSTVTTTDGVFIIVEVAFDYVRNEITVYSRKYDLDEEAEQYDVMGRKRK